MTTEKRRGRPRESLDGGERRHRAVKFSDVEWAAVKKLAQQAGLTTSDWVRSRALSDRPNPPVDWAMELSGK